MGVDLSIVRVGMQMEERRRVPLPRHWIGKMSCGGRSSAMEQVKEAGTPNLVGQAIGQRLAGTRQIDAASSHLYGYEEEPLPPTTVGVSTQNESEPRVLGSLVALREKAPPSSDRYR